MKRDLHDMIGAGTLLVPTTVNSDTASSWLDTRGYQSCDILVRIEAITGDGTITPKLQHGNTTEDDDAAVVDAADVVGNFAAVAAASDLVLLRAAYCGDKRYVRVLLDVGDTASATCTVLAIAGHASSEPAAAPTVAAAT